MWPEKCLVRPLGVLECLAPPLRVTQCLVPLMHLGTSPGGACPLGVMRYGVPPGHLCWVVGTLGRRSASYAETPHGSTKHLEGILMWQVAAATFKPLTPQIIQNRAE